MKDELNFSYNGGGDAYLLQSVAINFNLTVGLRYLVLGGLVESFSSRLSWVQEKEGTLVES